MNRSQAPQTQFDPARFKQLLRASFGAGDAAIENFQAWNAQINWDDHVNGEEYRLLPQLYRNLAAQGFQHPLLGKFKGIGRKAWYNNNLFFHRLAPTLQTMRDAGIETIVLYGGALALRYDNEYVMGFGADCGILVRTKDMRRAFKVLAHMGWNALPAISEHALRAYGNARFAHTFQTERGERLGLQWQLIPHCEQNDAEGEFWERARETTMDGTAVRVLEPTDQLLHSCVLGPGARGGSHRQRMMDAMLLLRSASHEIDWKAFPARIRAQHVVLPALDVVTTLAQEVPDLVPPGALQELKALPVSNDERRERDLWNATTRRERIGQLWQLAARRSCGANAFERMVRFPVFLREWWGLENLVEVPKRGLAAVRRQNGARG